MPLNKAHLQRILSEIPARYPGPGGAAAVLQNGELIAAHAWGYAHIETQTPVTTQTLFPICSISKQMFCQVLIDLESYPTPSMTGDFREQMELKLKEILPEGVVSSSGLTVDDLCDMCSGLRDYWALCTLWGSEPDSPYRIERDNPYVLSRMKSLHFEPGTEFSYSNINFNILGRLIEDVAKESLSDLLAERVFNSAGMATARLCPRCDELPAPIVGYEEIDRQYIPAINRVEWAGDAGVVASLEDMIAYEKYFDRKYTLDPEHRYRDIVKPREYKDGTTSWYRYGLFNRHVHKSPSIGHGGALRGFRLHREYAKEARLSVVVLFNHEADPHEAVEFVMAAALNVPQPEPSDLEAAPEWMGAFLDEQTQIAVVIQSSEQGRDKLTFDYEGDPDTLRLTDPTSAKSDVRTARIEGDILRVHCQQDNRILRATRIKKDEDSDSSSWPAVQGSYRNEELESTLDVQEDDGTVNGIFTGWIGKGPKHSMRYLGEDVWLLTDDRGMDATPPGDWTCVFRRDGAGNVVGVTVGCWLARKLEYVKV